MTLQGILWCVTAPLWMPVFIISTLSTERNIKQWKKAQLVDKYGDPLHPAAAKKWKDKSRPRHLFDI